MTKSSNSIFEIMKIPGLVFLCSLFAVIASCGASTTRDSSVKSIGDNSIADKTLTDYDDTENIDLINTVYANFVFAIDSDGDVIDNPEKYFTAKALEKLQEYYQFDCDESPCYAFYALRTEAQDVKPGSDGASMIDNIEPAADGWYIVSYSDMGWDGKTRIRISDGKIDDYERKVDR